MADAINHPPQVPECILANAIVMSDEEGKAALKLRKRFMRKGYNPVDRRDSDSDEDEVAVAEQAGETDARDPPAELPDPPDVDDLSDVDDPSDVDEPPPADDPEIEDLQTDIPDRGFPMSLSTQDVTPDMEDLRQYAAIKLLERTDLPRDDEMDESESDQEVDEEPAWAKNPETEEERIAIERGKKLVMTFEDVPLRDLDPAWFLLTFPDLFPNGRGLPPEGVSVIAWLKFLIRIDGSPFQADDFICAVGDWVLRHNTNLSAYLQFRVKSADFQTASLAEEEDVTRLATILARRGRPRRTDNRVVHALYSQVNAVVSRSTGNMYCNQQFRRQTFAGWQHFGLYSVFFTINKQETRSPFCWRMAGATGDLLQTHHAGDAYDEAIPEFDKEMIDRVRRHPVAQNRFYEIGITTFREVCCGFSRDGQYSQDYDQQTGKPKGFFGALDAVMLNREQSGRIAHHAHGEMISRAIKLHNFDDLMKNGAKQVIKWMANISCMVMGDYVVSLRPDGVTPARVKPEAVQGMPEDRQPHPIKQRPRSSLLSGELPSVDHLSPEEKQAEMAEVVVCLKTALLVHTHNNRCIGKGPTAQGNDTDCDMGFKPGPDTEPEGRWDEEKHELYLPRDRTKLVAGNEVVLLADRCNHNMTICGDNSARMPKSAKESRSFVNKARLNTIYNTKYDTKLDDLTGETLILNLVAAQKRTAEEKPDDPRKMIVRCVNAFNK